MELPDWLRGLVLLGRDGAEYRVVALDADGNMGVILQAAAEVTIPGDVAVDQNDSIREMQGLEGVTLRTVAVDANGQIIMVPRGSTGNYMAVDADGYLLSRILGKKGDGTFRGVSIDDDGQIIMVPRGATGNYMAVDASGYLGCILMADAAVTIAADVNVTQEASTREMQGKEGANLRSVAVDAGGRMIMVPRGNSGVYMDVNPDGSLSAMMRGLEAGVGNKTVAVDSDGQIIMVPRGSTGNYMAVDASGYMTTVIKGTYGATLKTLGTDDEGYLVAILKDNADQWGKKISVGLAELAARLGSPISWDRRGQVVQIITFENGFAHIAKATSGTGAECALYAGVSQTGGYSCKLKTGTTVSRSASVTTYSDFSPSDRVGFEFTFSMTDQPDDVTAYGRVWDGTNEHRAYMRWHKATNKLQILNSGLAWVDVCDFQLPAVSYLFVSVKLVIDLGEQEYVRLLSRGTEYDISAVASYKTASATHPYVTFKVGATEDAAVAHTIYVDRMVITTNEP